MLVPLSSDPNASSTDAVIVCLPYAGGNSVAFQPIAELLPENIAMVAYQPPGRGLRFEEPPVETLDDILDELIEPVGALTQKNCLFFGHSFGGLIAYELTKTLGARGTRLPKHLILSGSVPAHQIGARQATWNFAANCTEGELFDYLAQSGGVPDALIAHKEAFLPFMPSTIAEFRILQNFRHMENQALRVAFTTLCGREDTLVSPELMHGWDALFHEPGRHHVLPGDHYYLTSTAEEISQEICSIAQQSKHPTHDRQMTPQRRAELQRTP